MSGEEKKKSRIELQIDPRELLHSAEKLWKRFWWVYCILTVVLILVVTAAQYVMYTPEYKSYCSFTVKVVNDSTTGQINTLYGFYYDKDLAEQLDKTFTHILSSDLLNDEIKEQLGPDRTKGKVEAECIEGSNLFVLSTYGKTPEEAAKLMDAVLYVYVDVARFVVGEMQVEMVEQPITEDTPYNKPSLLLSAALGLAMSLSIGVLCALIYMEHIRTVRSPEQLEEKINMPCLGLIPMHESISDETGEPRHHGEFRESVRGVARKVEQALEACDTKVLLVTSTLPGEGKSTVCRQLAKTLADWDKKVYLIDGDLRKPNLYRVFKIKGRKLPLADVLRGEEERACVLESIGNHLWLVGNTEPVAEPTVLLDSPQMQTLIASCMQDADYVIIDAPPCDVMSDVALLQRYCAKVLYVVRQEYAQIEKICDAVEELCVTENKLMGYVLNGTVKTAQGYGKYGYGAYSYGKYGNGYYGHYGYYGKGYHKYYEEDKEPSKK